MSTLFFPPKVLEKMRNLRVSEAEIYEVFNKGEHGVTPDSKVAVRKYNGYEIGLFYAKTTKVSFDYIVIAVWKRERR
ncbi:MAG: hypothetical protein WCV93_04385 [Candidatus Shapirobacteria bacterium]